MDFNSFFAKICFFIDNFWYASLHFLFFLLFLLLILYFIFFSKSKIKIYLINLLLFLIVLLIFYYFSEAYLRFIYDKTDSIKIMLTSRQWLKRHVYDVNQSINPEGFRDTKDYKRADKKTKKIVVIGDSFSYGYGIKNINNRFSNLLEKTLNNEGYGIEIYNFGVQGANINEEKKLLKLAIEKVSPDLIIWQYFMNDIESEPTTSLINFKQKTKEMYKNPLFADLMERSYVFNFFYYRLSPALNPKTANKTIYDGDLYRNKKEWIQFKKKIENFIFTLKENETQVVVIIFPYMNLIGSNYPYFDIHKKIVEVFKNKNIPAIDLLEIYLDYGSAKLIVNKFDYHPNEKANNLAFKELYKKIKKFQLLEISKNAKDF